MDTIQRLDVYLPVRLTASLAAALAQVAKREAGAEKPNLSQTCRRAIRFYIQTIEGRQHEDTKTETQG